MRLGAPVVSPERLQLRRLAVFAQWRDEDALVRFLERDPLGQRLNAGWHVRLEFVRRWSTIAAFDGLPARTGTLEQDEPVGRLDQRHRPAGQCHAQTILTLILHAQEQLRRADLAAVIRSLGAERVALVGQGLGATFVWSMPTHHPGVTAADDDHVEVALFHVKHSLLAEAKALKDDVEDGFHIHLGEALPGTGHTVLSADVADPDAVEQLARDAIAHLGAEGLPAASIHLVGNPMIDTLLKNKPRFDADAVATLLETTVASVNSALQRARATLADLEFTDAAHTRLRDQGARIRELVGDFIEDAEATSAESAVIAGLMHTDVRAVLATLDEREQQVIRMRYGVDDGQPHTLDQIGKLFGLSRERVRQIEREVMAKLRVGERADRLRDYAM